MCNVQLVVGYGGLWPFDINGFPKMVTRGAVNVRQGQVSERFLRGKTRHGRETQRFFSFWTVVTVTLVAGACIATFSSVSSISVGNSLKDKASSRNRFDQSTSLG